jgi:hypothetical protein
LGSAKIGIFSIPQKIVGKKFKMQACGVNCTQQLSKIQGLKGEIAGAADHSPCHNDLYSFNYCQRQPNRFLYLRIAVRR